MGMKASEVGNGLRRMAGKRDHREVLRDDYLALRPGPNFDWLMGNLAAGQPTPAASETDPACNNRHEDDPCRQFSRRCSHCRTSETCATPDKALIPHLRDAA